MPLYAGNDRCGPEVKLYGPEIFPDGRLLAGRDAKAALELDQERRELQGGQSDLDICYDGEVSWPYGILLHVYSGICSADFSTPFLAP